MPKLDVLLSRVDQCEDFDKCWIVVQGAPNNGGYMTFQKMGAHVWMWNCMFGPLPNGWDVHHKCGNKPCINPMHLQSLTKNAHGLMHGQRRKKKVCKRGHVLSEVGVYIQNTYGYTTRNCKACASIRDTIRYRNNRRTRM